MESNLRKALAAGLAAATLSGGITMPAMADENANPPANGNGTAEQNPAVTPDIGELKDAKVYWRAGDNASNTEQPVAVDLTRATPAGTPGDPYTVEVDNNATEFRVDGYDASKWMIHKPQADPTGVYWTITITAKQGGATWTVRLKRAAPDKTTADKFRRSYETAKAILGSDESEDAYTSTTLGRLSSAADAAKPVYDTLATATENDIHAKQGLLDDAINGLEIANWTFDGQRLERNEDGVWTLPDGKTWDGDPKDAKPVTGGITGRRTTVAVKATETSATEPTLGVHVAKGDITGTDGANTFDIPYRHVTGAEITLDKTQFKYDKASDTWTAIGPNYQLDPKTNQPKDAPKNLVLSDGTSLPVEWGRPLLAKNDAQGRMWTATGHATGTLKGGEKVDVTVNASRDWSPTLALTVERRAATGDPQTIPTGIDLKDASASTDPITITLPDLPYEAIGDQYALAYAAGSDVTVTPGRTTLGDNGQRILTGTITIAMEDGKTLDRAYTITQSFAKPARKTDNPGAALESIRVNGNTIEGWDPDILQYTITAGENDKVTVSPQAREGQTVKASDATLTAYTTVQHWTVTGANGDTRTYTVTLVRDHKTPTMDEAFTPKDAVDAGGKEEAPKPSTTDVKSHGYMLGGEYTAVADDSYRIPAGGVFAYESYAGQTVRVQTARDHGMTWKYTLGVLAPDNASYAGHSYEVTYITPDTTRAGLTGINVDGVPVAGFKPDTLEYDVPAANPERYVVTPLWDKQTGMSVTKHVDGATTTLTVVSADGLNTVTYTVHAKDAASLAQTGVGVAAIILAAITALFAGLGAVLAARRHGDDDTDGGKAQAGPGDPAAGRDGDDDTDM